MATDPRASVLGAGDAAASGMPQLNVGSYPNQIFWLILALIAIYFVLSRVALPRIGAVLAERQGSITNDIAAAEELKLKATDAEKAYEKALKDARAESARIVEENEAELHSKLDARMEKAEAEIAERQEESQRRIAEIREQSMSNVEQVAKEAAAALVASLGGDADRGRTDAAVDQRLKERSS